MHFLHLKTNYFNFLAQVLFMILQHCKAKQVAAFVYRGLKGGEGGGGGGEGGGGGGGGGGRGGLRAGTQWSVRTSGGVQPVDEQEQLQHGQRLQVQRTVAKIVKIHW